MQIHINISDVPTHALRDLTKALAFDPRQSSSATALRARRMQIVSCVLELENRTGKKEIELRQRADDMSVEMEQRKMCW